MLRLVLLVALVAVVTSQGDISKKMMHQIAAYNFRAACWGQENLDNFLIGLHQTTEKCMQMEPYFDVEKFLKSQKNPFAPITAPKNPFKSLLSSDFENLQSLWRNKRATAPEEGFLEASEEDLIDFLLDFKTWGEDLYSSITNQTCVLVEMGYLDEKHKVNMDHYNNFDTVEGFDASKSLYGQDPELSTKLKNMFNDCKAIADSWPQSSLNKNPITKAFGRNIIFFKCAQKAEKAVCAMGQMYQWLVKLYGKSPKGAYGLPKDKYNAAAVSFAALDAAASPEEKAVNDFFWGRF